MKSRTAAVIVFLALLSPTACFTPSGPDGRDADPFELSNRAVFAFNDVLDLIIIEPLAKGWRFVTPEVLRVSLDRVFYNLRSPVRVLTNLGQGEGGRAGHEFARFWVNTTVGILGLWDPATRMGLGTWPEDFGQMFGHWGVPPGPYWVIPLLGPANPRDTFGFIFDWAFNITPGMAYPIVLINTRAILIPQADLAEDAALDKYVFIRDAYIQRRQAQVDNLLEDDPGAGTVSDDLYEIDPELEEDPAPEAGASLE